MGTVAKTDESNPVTNITTTHITDDSQTSTLQRNGRKQMEKRGSKQSMSKYLRPQKVKLGILFDERWAEDVRFSVGSAGKVFGANRGILAVRSAVFDAMLFGRMFESSAGVTVQIPDVEPDAFEAMLRFIYTGDLEVDAAIYPGLMYAIDKYLISDAQPLMLDALDRILSDNTAVGLLNAVRGKFESATDKIVRFIYIKSEVWWGQYASGLDFKSWEHLLDAQRSRDESMIFSRIIEQKGSLDGPEIKTLVQMLDFSKLPVPFIATTVRASGVFTDDEIFEILGNPAKPPETKWKTYKNLDSFGGDICLYPETSVEDLKVICKQVGGVAFNELGWIKYVVKPENEFQYFKSYLHV
eukprot:1010637_1